MLAPDEENRLITCAMSGDEAALEQLLLAIYDDLHRLISSKLPAKLQATVDADDILQMTCAEAFRDIGQFQPGEPPAFFRWVAAIAEHRLIDAIKLVGRKKRGGDFRQLRAAQQAQTDTVADLFELLSGGERAPASTPPGPKGSRPWNSRSRRCQTTTARRFGSITWRTAAWKTSPRQWASRRTRCAGCCTGPEKNCVTRWARRRSI